MPYEPLTRPFFCEKGEIAMKQFSIRMRDELTAEFHDRLLEEFEDCRLHFEIRPTCRRRLSVDVTVRTPGGRVLMTIAKDRSLSIADCESIIIEGLDIRPRFDLTWE